MKQKIWDVIIVGGGPAGCSAAVVLARCSHSVLLVDQGNQRNLSSQGIHNYLTREGILPKDYYGIVSKELGQYHVDVLKTRATNARAVGSKGFEIKTSDGDKYLCKRLLLATGVSDKIPDIPGMKELWGRTVFHCPFCDGWECREKTIGLYAKKYSGYGMSLTLRLLSERVILFTDGAKYLKPKQKEELEANRIEVIGQPIKRLVHSKNKLNGIELQNGQVVACDVVFTKTEYSANATLLHQLDCRCTKKGVAITNRQQQTNVPGVYVAGDAAFDMHFVVVAAAEGVKAAVSIHNDLVKAGNLIGKK